MRFTAWRFGRFRASAWDADLKISCFDGGSESGIKKHAEACFFMPGLVRWYFYKYFLKETPKFLGRITLELFPPQI